MKDGLSNPSVLSINQDLLGRMWFGTNNGLNMYDGQQIFQYKTYESSEGDTVCSHLISGSIYQIENDALGNVILRDDHSLLKYDVRKNRLYKVRTIGSVSSILAFNGEIWCTIRDSLFKMNGRKDELQFIRRLHIPDVYCMAKKDGTAWYGTAKGLYRSMGNKMECVLPQVEIYRVFISSRGEVWVGSRMEGLYRIGRNDKIHKEDYAPTRVVSQQIREFVEDDEQNIWFGTFDGLQKYNPYTDEYSVYRPNSSPNSLSHPSVFALFKDRQSTIWVGTYYGGLNYFNLKKDLFNFYPYSAQNADGLSFPIVGEMTEDNDHNLWIATDGGGVNMLDRKTHKFIHFLMGEGKNRNSILHNNVKSIAYDGQKDQVYIATYTGGLSRYDRKTRQMHNYLLDTGKPNPGRIIYYIQFYKGNLYLSAPNGLWMLNTDTGEFKCLIKDMHFLTFLVDKKGDLWLAGTMKLYRWRAQDREALNSKAMFVSLDCQAKITKVIQTSDGQIYTSTLGKGVFEYEKDKGKWKRFLVRPDSLLSDFCYNIMETPGNNILVTTDKSLYIYSPFNKTVYFVGLGLKDGISAVTEGCGVWAASDDLIYIGGVDGMISFREKDLFRKEDESIPLYFSGLWINNIKIQPDDRTGLLPESLPFVRALKLKCNQNNLTLSFSSSDYVEKERNVAFQYKLEGFDTDWVATDQMKLNYTNLSPGHYILKVRMIRNHINNEGEYEEVRLVIDIAQPWYLSWWALGLYFLAIAFVGYIIYNVRHNRQVLALSLEKAKNEKEKIEEVNKLKLRFFTNISHEFRTPLTLIVGQADVLLHSDKLPAGIKHNLQSIYRNAINLRMLITELLDFRRQEQGYLKLKVQLVDIIPFIKGIYQSFYDLARRRKITYRLECNETHIGLWIDPIQMQKVMYNLLSNAFKYTPDMGKIKIAVSKAGNDRIEISVSDTGCGIPPEAIEKVFARFYQVENESQEYLMGSGIGLAFAKGIVDAHKGKITVESTVGEGSCFKVTLQNGNGQFSAEELAHDRVRLSDKPEWDGMFEYEAKEEQPDTSEKGVVKGELPAVLIADDEPDMLDLLHTILSPYYQVIEAHNGKEAFEMAMQFHPVLIISDVMMPGMSGKELCYKIKSSLELAYVPVVLLTAQASEDYTIEGYMFGADDYIVKPFNVKLLLTRCDNLIRTRRKLLDHAAGANLASPVVADTLEQRIKQKAIETIKANFTNPDFSMDDLAAALNMGRTKMFSVIKDTTGLTPNELTLKVRLEEALHLIQTDPDCNISEISYRVGFSSPRYFSRCFKTFYGVTPQNYRTRKGV